jgi:hypothetical protein
MDQFPFDDSPTELDAREADEARAEDEAESEARAMLDDERAAAEAMARDDVRDERDWYELLEAA